MHGFNGERLIAALALLATLMYLIAVAPGFGRYRRATRIIAIAVYALALAVALAGAVLWLLGITL
jgi:hypothetical protein